MVEEEHDKHLSTYWTEVRVAGFGRIVASEIVVRNMFANLV